ncbi:MAG: efflux RND transporter periplasmic adaptor subunit [Gammaproteobacteria bacterium]
MPQFKILKNKFYLVLASLICIILGALAFKFVPFLFMKPFSPPPTLVNAVTTQTAQWPLELKAVGSLEAVQAVDLATEVDGRVQAILFESGDAVKAGQLLLQLNDETEQANLKIAQAKYKLAQIDLTRSQKLSAQKFVSEFDLDQKKAALDEATASIEAATAAVHKKHIIAPFDGVLGIRQIKLGEYLQPGQIIASLTDLNSMHLNFSLPEKNMPQLKIGQTVQTKIEALPENIFEGKITAIDPKLDTKNRNISLQANLANPQGLLFPGMFAEAQILLHHPDLPAAEPLIVLPETAVDYSLYGNTVYVIEADPKNPKSLRVHLVYVKTGPKKNQEIAILSGLKAGQRVVADGQIKLHDKAPVMINPNSAPNLSASNPQTLDY